jgi:hypothetical protein
LLLLLPCSKGWCKLLVRLLGERLSDQVRVIALVHGQAYITITSFRSKSPARLGRI